MTRPTLALLPGLLCDEAVWAPQCESLSPHAHCVVPDYAVAGSLQAMAEAVLEQLPPGPFAVAGHSMGGRIALELMRRVPERVERLALLDTGTHPLPAGEAGAAERA